MPSPGDNFAAMAQVIKLLLALVPCSAIACSYPDEGNMPLRRAVTRVEMLPEVEAWSAAMKRTGVIPQVTVLPGESVHRAGKCYWPVDVRAGDRLWRRYLVTPDGKRVIDAAEPPRAASPPAAS